MSNTIYNVIKIFNPNGPHTFGVFPMNKPCIMEFDSEMEARAYAQGCEARAALAKAVQS